MPDPTLAKLQVWGKGFRVTERSEEFQLFVPPARTDVDESELQILQLDWGATLTALYKLDDEQRRRQFWMGVSPSAVTVLLVEGSHDRHKRRSVVAVAATTPINWRTVNLAWVVARAARLSRRYSQLFGRTLDGAPDRLQQQLKDGTFLSERVFDLRDEKPDQDQEWEPLCESVRRWRGITAVATRALLPLGANVFYGKRADLERERVAGVFDPDQREIEALTDEISPWKVPIAPVSPIAPAADAEPLQRIDDRLKEIRDEQRELREQTERIERRHERTNTLMQSLVDLAQTWFDIWTGRRR